VSVIGVAVPNRPHSGVFRMCKRKGPRGRRKSPSGVQGQSPRYGIVPQKLTLFVTECLNFDVLEEKISKTAKNNIIKNYGRLKGGPRRKGPPKYATEAALVFVVSSSTLSVVPRCQLTVPLSLRLPAQELSAPLRDPPSTSNYKLRHVSEL